jgi:hypothetical protein
VTSTEVDLVPVEPLNLVAPVAGAAALVENQKAYHAVVHALLDDSDYQATDRGRFKKKSAWRKLNVAFNVTTELLDEVEARDEQGRLIRATVTARATAPNGRYADGIGVCDVHDRHTRACLAGCVGFHHFAHPEHDILATAHTRATNRASSDLYGMGEVSAEEIDANTAPPPAVFDPMALIGPYLEDDNVRAELAAWRRRVRLPAPSRFNPEQTAEALVQIGRIMERDDHPYQMSGSGSPAAAAAPAGGPDPDPVPADVIDDQPEAYQGEPGTERYDPADPKRPFA